VISPSVENVISFSTHHDGFLAGTSIGGGSDRPPSGR
jgi:hypothetical protein